MTGYMGLDWSRCNAIEQAQTGKRGGWHMHTCTLAKDHEGKHWDSNTDYRWDGPVVYWDEIEYGQTQKTLAKRRKKFIAADQEEIDRNNRAAESIYYSRTGQMTLQGKKHMDSDWERDMQDIDAFFLDLYSHLYEDYYGSF